MKKYFALATALVSLSAMMTSCGNNSEANDVMAAASKQTLEDNTPAKTVQIGVAIMDGQEKFVDEEFTVTLDDKTYQFKTSDLTEVATTVPQGGEAGKKLEESFLKEDKGIAVNTEYKMLLYTLSGTFKHGTVTVSGKFVPVMENRPVCEEYNLLKDVVVIVDGKCSNCYKPSTTDVRFYKGLTNTDEDVAGFAECLNEYQQTVTAKF